MSKVVKLSSVMEREEKLKEIYEGLEEIKDQLTELIDEYEEEETHTEETSCEDRGRRGPSTSQGERSQSEINVADTLLSAF